MIRRQATPGIGGVLICCTLFVGGCASRQIARPANYEMGERVFVKPLIYNVIETKWKSQLGDIPKVRVPQNRFLLVRLSVTNSGRKEASVPLLAIEDSSGNSYTELSDGENIDDWLGLLRTVAPADTDQGWIAFDVPLAFYRLRVTNAADPGDEQFAFVNLPLRLDSDTVLPPGK